MRLPLGVIHANSFTEEEIEKYKREQIEKYERQQKENQELLQQIREGKTSPTFVAEKRPSISEERGTFVQTINQGIQDATEEQKKEKNEKLKTQILFLQVTGFLISSSHFSKNFFPFFFHFLKRNLLMLI